MSWPNGPPSGHRPGPPRSVGSRPTTSSAWPRAYGTTRPAFIRTLIGAEHHENGAMFFRTLACLPALTGSWKDRGGGFARSVGSWAETMVDDSVFDPANGAARRSVNMNHLGRALTDESMAPPVKALFVWCGNPVVTVPNAELIRTGLEREDLFTVVSEQFLTDTARYADVVFPATTQLEQLDMVPSWGHLYLGWNEPAIEPRGESVPNTELWRRLSRAMGLTDPPLRGRRDACCARHSHGGSRCVAANGFLRLDLPEDLRAYAAGGFATTSGKAELSSPALAAAGHDPVPQFVAPTESAAGTQTSPPATHWRC